jgi:predicted phage terminase large subunit-like protein
MLCDLLRKTNGINDMGYADSLWGRRWQDLSAAEKEALATVARDDFKVFARVAFWIATNAEFQWVDGLHDVIQRDLMGIWCGLRKNEILNIPPRYGKTELACMFCAWAFGHNSRSEYLHISFSDNLIVRNSKKIRWVMDHEFYHMCFDTRLDSGNAKIDEWQTTDGGLFQCRTTFGKVTGLGCGSKAELDADGRFHFSGMLWIDDPLKPSDAHTVERVKVNEAYSEVLRSRLNSPMTTPTLVTMQRLHEEDFTWFLLNNYGFNQIKIKGLQDNGVPLWPFMHSAEDFATMKAMEPYTFASQYQQEPTPKGGSIFFRDNWRRWAQLPKDFERVIITADTAQKIKEHNDFSVFQLWGKFDGRVYLIDQLRGKWEADVLLSEATRFITASKMRFGQLREAYVEDKASGTGLIQQLPRLTHGTAIIPVQRSKDKITRSQDVVPYVNAGQVLLPPGASWVEGFINEAASFNALMTHGHDDQIDPMMDAVKILLDDSEISMFDVL